MGLVVEFVPIIGFALRGNYWDPRVKVAVMGVGLVVALAEGVPVRAVGGSWPVNISTRNRWKGC